MHKLQLSLPRSAPLNAFSVPFLALSFLHSVGMTNTKILAKIETRQALLNFQVRCLSCGYYPGIITIFKYGVKRYPVKWMYRT